MGLVAIRGTWCTLTAHTAREGKVNTSTMPCTGSEQSGEEIVVVTTLPHFHHFLAKALNTSPPYVLCGCSCPSAGLSFCIYP